MHWSLGTLGTFCDLTNKVLLHVVGLFVCLDNAPFRLVTHTHTHSHTHSQKPAATIKRTCSKSKPYQNRRVLTTAPLSQLALSATTSTQLSMSELRHHVFPGLYGPLCIKFTLFVCSANNIFKVTEQLIFFALICFQGASQPSFNYEWPNFLMTCACFNVRVINHEHKYS